jgi:hypothetical protein
MTDNMKISRSDLIKLIAEELRRTRNVLLESPGYPIVGQEQEGDHTKDPDEYKAEEVKKTLYHMARQADQLHDIIMGNEDLAPEIVEKISVAGDHLEMAFKVFTYDKQHPEGR